MYCRNCGKAIDDKAVICPGCGVSTRGPINPAVNAGVPFQGTLCPKCGVEMNAQVTSEMKKRGCLAVLLYIILLCIPVVGWIALFSLLRGKKSKLVTYMVCPRCGYRFKR